MPLTASDVANKQFTTVKLREGYNMEEVDGFLDEVEAELGRLHREIDDLTARANATAAAPAAPAPAAPAAPVAAAAVAAAAPSDSAVRMLELAQKTADEHVAGAKAEADRILADARATHARTMGDLESERTAMQTKVEELRAFEKEYRTRLRSYLEGQLRDLEAKGPQVAPPAPSGSSGPPAPASPAPSATPSPAPSAPPVTGQGQGQGQGQGTGQPPAQPGRPFAPAPAPDAPSGPPVQAD